jgi:hypothetical protein
MLCCAVVCCGTTFGHAGAVAICMAVAGPIHAPHMRAEFCAVLCCAVLCCAVLCCFCRSTYGDSGAVAICMAGGYKDDEDTGETFTYTGAGGQKQKRQVGTAWLSCLRRECHVSILSAPAVGWVYLIHTGVAFSTCAFNPIE